MSSNAHSLTSPVVTRSRRGSSRLHWVRAGAVIGQAVLLGLAHQSPGQQAPLLMLAACMAVGAAATMLGLQQLRREDLVDDAAFFRQILIDLMVLTGMLAISGGPANPFHDAYFLPVAVAAAWLPARYTWFIVATSLACYSLVQVVYLPLPGSPEDIARALGPGEWITHALLASLAAYFLLRITHNLREHERQLCLARESAARAESAVVVGSIAAGAAHELGTPLMTISAVLDEMQALHGQRPELRPSLELLAGSVAECRKTLDVLRQSGRSWAPARERVPVRTMIDHVVARFRGMRPGLELTTQFGSTHPEPTIVPDLALQQAIINLLGNAAAASPHFVALAVDWTSNELKIRVTDRGPGLAPEVADRLGNEFVSTHATGCGLGLFLTRVTAQRLGGDFDIRNAADGGAVATIVVPLASLQTTRS